MNEPLPGDPETAAALSLSVRALLSQPVPRGRLTKLITTFGQMMKWPSQDVIADPPGFLEGLHYTIERRQYAQPIVALALLTRIVEREEWMPSTKRVVEVCEEVKGEIEARLHELEAPVRQRKAEEADLRAVAEREELKKPSTPEYREQERAAYRQRVIEGRRLAIEELERQVVRNPEEAFHRRVEVEGLKAELAEIEAEENPEDRQ
jgi:hypothetical protein